MPPGMGERSELVPFRLRFSWAFSPCLLLAGAEEVFRPTVTASSHDAPSRTVSAEACRGERVRDLLRCSIAPATWVLLLGLSLGAVKRPSLIRASAAARGAPVQHAHQAQLFQIFPSRSATQHAAFGREEMFPEALFGTTSQPSLAAFKSGRSSHAPDMCPGVDALNRPLRQCFAPAQGTSPASAGRPIVARYVSEARPRAEE